METPFTITANPGTDIWKKPPTTDDFNAPYKPHSSAPLLSFTSATVTFTCTYTQQFDQAGILLRFTKPTSQNPTTTLKWIKAGVEFFDNQPRLSTVCCDNYADWSVASMPSGDVAGIINGSESVTILVEKEDSASGLCWWVYCVGKDGKKLPMREIAWIYGDNAGEGCELEVSAAVARPAKTGADSLEAKFLDVDVEWQK